MRNPIDVLNSLSEKSKNPSYRFQRLYRNLYNPEFYMLAYKNIYANDGSMTPGMDGTTLDGMSSRRIDGIIASLRDHSYQPKPARREYIPKKSDPNKKRPLGIPSANDKLVQEVVRLILESIYEPNFSENSHGFRPRKSCHTALLHLQRTFTGAKWFVEGDIKACFDGIDHHVLIDILRRRTVLSESVVTAKGLIGGWPAVVAVMDGRFLMGSMGVAVGEKVALAADTARKAKLPLVIFCASGGARMQEGILSLMQMAKTAEAITRFQQAGGLYIACLTHPTTGGVTASFASLGDITLAEPKALIGFAGPRVIEQTIGQKLPEGFQRSEYLEEHGFVDAVVPRGQMKSTLMQLLRLHAKGGARRG